ncbi:MAG: class I SAM-dependent methyltransferase [Candidatus Tectomicrobia bacterium]
MTDPNEQDHSWLNELSIDSQEISKYYDGWAEDYDQTLAQWNYQSPLVAADLLKQQVSLEAPILDAGCGTGLSGQALKAAGYRHIIGADISQSSLDIAAQSGAYERLMQVNMQHLPLPFESNAFAGVVCVGVLTYLPDTGELMREFCRVVRPGGLVVFTQRNDLFRERDFPGVLQGLEDEGVWEKISVSEPKLYLPGNEEFSDKIKVIYSVFRRR